MPRRDDRINPPRDPRQLRVTAERGRVVVERGDGHRREWDDVMVVAQDHKGVWFVAAAGDRLAADEAERDAARRYRQVRRRSALSPDGFDAEVALAYLKYVIFASASDLPFWRRFRKPHLALDLHGFEAIPTAASPPTRTDPFLLVSREPGSAQDPWAGVGLFHNEPARDRAFRHGSDPGGVRGLVEDRRH